jgi:glutathione S-transferase
MRPAHVTVYGNDHSPWVQAVLLGLHEAGIPWTLVAAPPPGLLFDSGVLMPAVRFDDGPWRYDSGRVLAALGYGAVDEAPARALSNLFFRAALTRVEERWAFWHRFSFSRDGDPDRWRRAWHNVGRALPVFYFFVLISLGRLRAPASDAEAFAAAFAKLQRELPENAPFFGGSAPDTLDFQLFGLVQMLETMPRLPLDVLCHHPTLDPLRPWVGAMQARFADYDRLYTAQHFEPRSPARPVASAFERTLFWCGAAGCWLAAPVTVPLVLLYSRRVRRKGLVDR